MSRTGDQFIEATGGFNITDPSTFSPAHGLRIRKLEEELKSGKLSPNEFDRVREQICRLKGLPPDEWDYEPADD